MKPADLTLLVTREMLCGKYKGCAIVGLPDIHRDPFDRILIAQAMCEPLGFLTLDHSLAGYSELVVRVWQWNIDTSTGAAALFVHPHLRPDTSPPTRKINGFRP